MHLGSSPFFLSFIIGFLLKFLHPLNFGSKVQAVVFFARVVSEDEAAGFHGTLYFLPSPSFVLDVLAQRFRSLTFKALPFFAHIISKDEVACFPGFFLRPDDFAPNVCSLQTLLPMLALLMLMLFFCVFFVSQASLARLCSRCF